MLVPDTDHLYVCDSGHEFAVDPRRNPKPMKRCPAYHLGSPCRATFHRVGKGSRVAR